LVVVMASSWSSRPNVVGGESDPSTARAFHLNPQSIASHAPDRQQFAARPLSSSQHRASAVVSTGSSAAAPPLPDLEIVWNGCKPRLLRKLALGTAAPVPDFECAGSRAVSTARRLKLQPCAHSQATRSSGSGAMPFAVDATTSAAQAKQRPNVSMPARAKAEHEWLAPEQPNLLATSQSARHEVNDLLSGRARGASVGSQIASSSWRGAGESLRCLQLMTPNVPVEGVLLGKLDRRGSRSAGDAAPVVDARGLDLETALQGNGSWRF